LQYCPILKKSKTNKQTKNKTTKQQQNLPNASQLDKKVPISCTKNYWKSKIANVSYKLFFIL